MISGSRPRLAVAYGYRSLDVMSLRAAARSWCDLIWLVDSGDPAVAEVWPLLGRTGEVVDVGGLSPHQAADALAAHEPHGLATFYDTDMERLAMIAAELGLSFHTPAVARALEDKLFQRQALRSAGVPSPRAVALPSGIGRVQALDLVATITFPAMLKPRRGSGSWHTFRVDTPQDLGERWDNLADQPSEERVLEEYLPDGPSMPGGFEADYVSVESVVVDGRATHLATTGRLPLAFPFRETGFFIPSTLEGETLRAVLKLTGEALTGLGVRVGATHTEIKLTAGGPRVIEVNGRIGGGVPEMLALSAGVDIIALSMRAALGRSEDLTELIPTSGVAYRFFYQPPPTARRLTAIRGTDKLRALPGVESIDLHHQPGATLDARDGSRTYLFAIVGSADDHTGMQAINDHLRTDIEACYD